MQNLFLIQI